MPYARLYAASGLRLLPLDGGPAVIPGGGGEGPPDNPPPTGNRNSMLVGAAGVNLSGSDFPALDAAAGPFTTHRVYEDEAVGFSFTSWAASRGGGDVGKYATVWSCKPDLARLGAEQNNYDAKITAFVKTIPDTHVAFLTVWHEVDGKIRKGTKDPSGQTITLSAWLPGIRRFCDAVHAAGKPHVYTALIAEAWTGQSPQAGSTYAEIWPGDGYIDVFAVDGYSNTGSGSALWGPAVTFAQGKNVPWAIAEIGCSGTLDTSWMQTQADYAGTHSSGQHTKAAFMCWFSNTVGGVVATPGSNGPALAKAKSISQAYYTDVNSYLL